jgi:ribosome assembly protein 3
MRFLHLRQEPNFTTAKLALLIESLASGAEVFTSSATPENGNINEMEVVVQ